MLVKILGLFDLIAGLILLFGAGFSLPNQMMIFFGMILLAKSCLGLLKDFASWIDFLCGLFFLISIIIAIPQAIGLILGILIIQKSIFSFL
ncbi:MAG: hypothetical protein KJ646_03650 [Nanoarchaeota archaeon]|nr:hypothetical protein [Nanoarchaeota archaeon]